MSSSPTFRKGEYGSKIVVGIVYIGFLLLFTWQTWEFLATLFPTEDPFYLFLSVASIDGASLLFAALDVFYPFLDPSAKWWCNLMWGVTFAISMLATFLFLFFFHNPVLHISVDSVASGWVILADAIVVVAISLDVLILTIMIRKEIQAGALGNKNSSQAKQRLFTEEELRDALSRAYDEGRVEAEGNKNSLPSVSSKNGKRP